MCLHLTFTLKYTVKSKTIFESVTTRENGVLILYHVHTRSVKKNNSTDSIKLIHYILTTKHFYPIQRRFLWKPHAYGYVVFID